MTRRVDRAEQACYDGTTGDPTVLAFDPGATTGWALMSVHPEALVLPDVRIFDNVHHFAYGQFTGSEFDQVDRMVELVRGWPGAAIVCEDFVMRRFDAGREVLSPVRLSAAFRYACSRGLLVVHSADGSLSYDISKSEIGRGSRIQQPSLAMTTITDDRLKRLGYYERTAGKPHARDATRHVFTFFKRLKENEILRKGVFPDLDSTVLQF